MVRYLGTHGSEFAGRGPLRRRPLGFQITNELWHFLENLLLFLGYPVGFDTINFSKCICVGGHLECLLSWHS